MEAAVSDGSNRSVQLEQLPNVHLFLRFWDFLGPDHCKHALSPNLTTIANLWRHLRQKSCSEKEEDHGKGDCQDLLTSQKNLPVLVKFSLAAFASLLDILVYSW